MGSNWRLPLGIASVLIIVIFLNKFSNIKSQRERVLEKVFSTQVDLDGEWLWENQKWAFFYDEKSSIIKNSVWFILRSRPVTKVSDVETNNNYSIINLKAGEVFFKQNDFVILPEDQRPKFEIKKISDTMEALFFTEKKCQRDFCSENVRIFLLDLKDLKEIGHFPLSASNLATCKKDKTPCFEFYGKYSLEKGGKNSFKNIKVIFKGFEEDAQGNSKPLESENYIFENGTYLAESLKSFH